MYTTVLLIHSWLRWAVIIIGLVAVFRSAGGGRRSWTTGDEAASRWFIVSLDVQFLLGVILYFALSPITPLAFEDFGAAMRTPGIRFWAVEHVFGMVVGLALAHIGRARIRKAPDDRRRHRRAVIFYTLALVAILAAIPWPGMPNARPLFRLF